MERVCDQCIFDDRLWKALPDPQKNTQCGRCKRKRCTTRLTSADRIKEIRPPRAAKSIDWEGLKQKFFAQTEHQALRAFLRAEGWSDTQIGSGNASENTVGWGEERDNFRRVTLEAAREANKQAIIDFAPEMYAAKLKIVKRLIKKADTEDDVRDVIAILESIKTELGEPTRVSKSQISLSDEVEEAIKELRNVVNTGGTGANDGGGTTEPAATATTPDPS